MLTKIGVIAGSLCGIYLTVCRKIYANYTLWPFWVDTHVDPPFKKDRNGQVYDIHKRQVKHFVDVPEILSRLHDESFTLAIASRTSCTVEANTLIELFGWNHFFRYREIYPGTKVTHFKKLCKDSGVSYEDMIFFDDEYRNIVDVRKLGVLCVHIDDSVGVTNMVVLTAFHKFAQRKRESGANCE